MHTFHIYEWANIEGESHFIKVTITRNVLLSAQMGERVLVVLICIITSRYNEVK